MSWFDDVDKWFKRIQKYFEELEREMEEEMERMIRGEGFTEEEEGKQSGGKAGRGPKYYYYGFEISIGPDGKPRIKEFGNVRPKGEKPIIEEDIEPLTDVIEEEDNIKVVMDMPGVDKDKINVKVSEDGRKVIISAKDTDRKYYKEVELPAEVDPSQSKATYRNGVLTIELKKKTTQRKGFDIKVE